MVSNIPIRKDNLFVETKCLKKVTKALFWHDKEENHQLRLDSLKKLEYWFKSVKVLVRSSLGWTQEVSYMP